MVLEEGYNQGLDAFLSGNVNRKDLADISKAILHYTAYILPFYGLVDQRKKPKEERSKAGMIFSEAAIAGLVIKLGLLYGGKVAATGNWHPFKFDSKHKTEQIEGVIEKKKDNLEKCVDYDELLE
jgi:hypothetical protein